MKYKHERFSLNKLCEFYHRDVEAEFMAYERAASINTVRILSLLMGCSFALFAFLDYYFYGGRREFFVALGLRALVLFITVVSCFLVSKFSRYEHALLMVTCTELLVFAVFLLILYSGYREFSLQFMSALLSLLTVFLIPNKWKNCLFAACVILGAYITFSYFFLDLPDSPPLIRQGIYLGICLVFCATFIYSRERCRRKQFAAEKTLEFMSLTDRLTGIYNRAHFELILGNWIKNKRHDPFCLLFFDIDNFKRVNDRFGHTEGDRVLVETARIVSAHIRDEDIFARWGGEEFVILFSGMGLEKAAELAERVRKALEDNPDAKAEKITVSIGVALYRKEETLLELVNRADAKMYEAKKAGKNRVVAESAG